MSFSEIQIFRDLPIKANKVQLPPNTPLYMNVRDKDEALADLPQSQLKTIHRGSRGGVVEMLRLPPITPDTWYAADPVADLNS